MGRHEHKIQGREGFFDYCSSPVRSDQNDLFLWANTTFGITSHGGANEPAFVFKTPLFFLDFGEYFNQINRISDINYLMLPKQWISRNGKLMKIEELFDTGLILGPSINWTQLRELGITFRMNTLQDTINALEDFIEEIDCNFSTLPTKIKESYLLADSKICISRYARMN
jgi:putative glycosyltransferase (TIGR04372 family)